MERAEDLFDRLRKGGESVIDELIQGRQPEALFLEFKRATTPASNRGLDSSDRANLSKAISGFGNSEGGVLVWGVECDETASSKLPLDDPSRFQSQ